MNISTRLFRLLLVIFIILLCINQLHLPTSQIKSSPTQTSEVKYFIQKNNQNRTKTELFIVINARNPSYVPVWLEDCMPPICSYQIFADNRTDFALVSHKGISQTVEEYPKHISSGYRNFGFRGRYQMEWAIQNADFDWYIKLDDDGYLCIDSLVHTLRHNDAPKKKFLYGRFHCAWGRIHADENFLALSRDAVEYFLVGWEKNFLLFDGDITMGNIIGFQLSYLHHTCGWTFWSDRKSFRWDEKMKPFFSCNSHVWFHHVKPKLIEKLHVKHKEEPFDPTIERISTLHKNDTGCNIRPGLPPYSKKALSKILIFKERTDKHIRIKIYANLTKVRTRDDYC